MKRFVDLRPAEIAGYRFAFWCTVENRFEEFSGDTAWGTLEEFRESAALEAPFAWLQDQERHDSLVKRLDLLADDWARESWDMMEDEREWQVVEVKK